MSEKKPNSFDNDPTDNEPICFVIADDYPSTRLDKTVASLIPEHSRSRIQGWIEREHVLVNGITASVKYMVKPKDVIMVTIEEPPESRAFTPQDIPFEVVDESADWIVVNKTVGLVVHPGAGNWEGTLLNGLLYRYPELLQIPRAGIVHRLDKDTSGLMVVARTLVAQTHLVRQLQARSVGRQYVALAMRHLCQAGTVNQAIGRDAKVPVRMSVDRPIAPKPAITHYTPQRLGAIDDTEITKVVCKLETGRTHQIRVHMASLGHPLLGDTLYGGKVVGGAVRQMLHAQALKFIDPSDETERAFQIPLPSDMEAVINTATWYD